MYADSNKIKWLLFESGQSITQIHNETGIPMSTISDLVKQKSSIEQMRLNNASKLTELAEKTSSKLTKVVDKYPEKT
ncbi:hypothetical protein F6X86_13920 [Enterococcus durans]|uniref:HTH cro/C1-type domain-containing protein n=2 Tax=Enterococcus TaxID=1350 RepID=A0A5N0YMD9_9ENTE|nr:MULTISPECIES: hypothetical protein [Enterococcus]EMF0517607.1 hypothetical protein [Enterococcus hirae]KAA9176601.1 hypothetical protein F6X86_13920 [Enterococcus durans]KAA9182375.1 hypothetical protein F6X85_13630 [Enterococcus durans]KAA9183058.1 hypothetical protein F6X90_14400 [Enterococcus durans]KAA9187222.1 hypothetical protein F6Y12_14420 [Enterococcus durans]